MKLVALMLSWFYVTSLILVNGDVGTATSYAPPFLPTTCPGYNQDDLPEGGLFAAASSGIWDNGAACGRRYKLRCLSGLKRPCKDESIVVEVVDLCKTNPCSATLLLPNKAFDLVSKVSSTKINIEYSQI